MGLLQEICGARDNSSPVRVWIFAFFCCLLLPCGADEVLRFQGNITAVTSRTVQVEGRRIVREVETALINHHPSTWKPEVGDNVVVDYRRKVNGTRVRLVGTDLFLMKSGATGELYRPHNSGALPAPGSRSAGATSSPVSAPVVASALTPPLHKAVGKGDLETVRSMIENGTDPKAVDGNGDSALHLAAALGDWKIIQYLLAQGALVEATNSRGETPLHLAAKRGWLEAGELLIGAGAPLGAKDAEGLTPLDRAKICKQGSARQLEAALLKAAGP